MAHSEARAHSRRSPAIVASVIAAALIITACKATKTPDVPPAAHPADSTPIASVVPLGPVPEDTAATMLKSLKLTMPMVQQFAKAQTAFDKVNKANPELLAAIRQRTQTGSLDDVVASLSKEPKFRSALGAAGSNPRSFIITGMALTQSMQGLQMLAAGKPLPAGLSPTTLENISFVQKNLPTIKEILKPDHD